MKEKKTLQDRISGLKDLLKEAEKKLQDAKVQSREPSAAIKADHLCKQIEEEIELFLWEERAEKRDLILDKMRPLVAALREEKLSQVGQWEILLKLFPLASQVERLMGVRKRWRRIDFLQCEILDPAWRARLLPHVSTSALTPTGPREGSRVDPAHENDRVIQYISWAKAQKLEDQGRLRIIDEGPDPLYDIESNPDSRPPLLQTVEALDFGAPVDDEDGKILPEFQVAQKELGGEFRISFESVAFLANQVDLTKKFLKQAKGGK